MKYRVDRIHKFRLDLHWTRKKYNNLRSKKPHFLYRKTNLLNRPLVIKISIINHPNECFHERLPKAETLAIAGLFL